VRLLLLSTISTVLSRSQIQECGVQKEELFSLAYRVWVTTQALWERIDHRPSCHSFSLRSNAACYPPVGNGSASNPRIHLPKSQLTWAYREIEECRVKGESTLFFKSITFFIYALIFRQAKYCHRGSARHLQRYVRRISGTTAGLPRQETNT
jgi:hypothetical protein